MAKASTQVLSPAPFTTYRDPQTGRWMVAPNPERSLNQGNNYGLSADHHPSLRWESSQ